MWDVWLSYVTVTCQAATTVTFAVAAGSKTLRPGAFTEFRLALPRMLPMPARLAGMVTWLVVVAEAVTAVVVAVPATALSGFLLATIMMVVFTISIIVMIRRRSTEPCHCFGVSTRPPGLLDVVRNVVLAAIALTGLIGTATSPGSSALAWGALVLTIGVGAVVALLLLSLAEIAEILAPVPASGS